MYVDDLNLICYFYILNRLYGPKNNMYFEDLSLLCMLMISNATLLLIKNCDGLVSKIVINYIHYIVCVFCIRF